MHLTRQPVVSDVTGESGMAMRRARRAGAPTHPPRPPPPPPPPTPKAITATAPTLARLLDAMLKHSTAYVRQSLADDAQHDRDRMIQNLTRRAKAWGYALVQTPAGTPL